MVSVLIPTQPDDTHAIYAKLALNKKGHNATLWYTADFPIQQKHSFELQKDIKWSAIGTDLMIRHHDEFDIVWYRRPKKPVLPASIHPDDIDNAEKEILMFYQTWWKVIAPNANWINSEKSSKLASSKLLQLKIASEVGLNTPHTLISNDPDKINDFISQYNDGEVVYKTLHPMFWLYDHEIRLTYTKSVSVNDLPESTVLQNTPGIFQKKIEKAFELRITYFGNYPVAAKLKSQEHPKGKMDWRYVPTKELIIEEYKLPVDINLKCQAFMKRFGLVFGCFDFIVTPDGEYYFLEINEQGQFLWIEDVNPDIKMLDIFTNFLIHNNSNFNWNKSSSTLSLSDFRDRVTEIQSNAMKIHLDPK